MILVRFFASAVAVLLLSGCEKSDSNANDQSPSGTRGAKQTSNGATTLTTKSGVEMIALPGGEFVMGNDHGNADEVPAHKVKLSPFLIDKLEVTHEMFAKAQLPDPSHWQENLRTPVERVRWRDAKRYCNERSLLEGLKPCYNEKTTDWDCDYAASGYRLPTEAEWEYAARAGTDGAFDFVFSMGGFTSAPSCGRSAADVCHAVGRSQETVAANPNAAQRAMSHPLRCP